MSQPAQAQLAFPPSLVGHADLSKLLRELEEVDNNLEAQRARSGKKTGAQLPVLSRVLSDLLASNKIDLANDHVRMELRTNLRKLKDHAPTIHMTFAAEADPESMQQVVAWVRKELHPQALITAGLQPALIGGVYVRTPNHVHDFSLRAHMESSREVIVKSLDSLLAGVQGGVQ